MTRPWYLVVGDVISCGLREAGVTQAQFAERAGISLRSAHRRLNGGRCGYLDIVAAADLMGIKRSELVERIEAALALSEKGVHHGGPPRIGGGMSEGDASVREACEQAQAVVLGLFAKYGITRMATAKHDIRERFTQEDFDTYCQARARLMGMGALG